MSLILYIAEETLRSAGNAGMQHAAHTSVPGWDGAQGISCAMQAPTTELYTSSLEHLSSWYVSAHPPIPKIPLSLQFVTIPTKCQLPNVT